MPNDLAATRRELQKRLKLLWWLGATAPPAIFICLTQLLEHVHPTRYSAPIWVTVLIGVLFVFSVIAWIITLHAPTDDIIGILTAHELQAIANYHRSKLYQGQLIGSSGFATLGSYDVSFLNTPGSTAPIVGHIKLTLFVDGEVIPIKVTPDKICFTRDISPGFLHYNANEVDVSIEGDYRLGEVVILNHPVLEMLVKQSKETQEALAVSA